jgi:pyruvate, water dikinase
MKLILSVILAATFVSTGLAHAAAKVMNPGEAIGQLVFLTAEDVMGETPKYKSLSPLSIPVFAELPLDMSVIAGAITLKQQNLLSHVQLKSRARGTPNLDISELESGMLNPLLSSFKDGDWVHMLLKANGEITVTLASEQEAVAFAEKNTRIMSLNSDLSESRILNTRDLGSVDYVRVGTKAANYAEIANLLNTPSRTVVKTGMAVPFYYYQQFIESNPNIKAAISSILSDPLMLKLAKVSYREAKLKALQEMMLAETTVIDENLITELMARFEVYRIKGVPQNMKLRSSTNSEDLPNFNGAGLYTSESYKPLKDGVEKDQAGKIKSLKKTLRIVWSSVWNLRAFDERNYFGIPHADVKMGIQINPSFSDEVADGVVVTKNIANDSRFPGPAVYIEVQRGDKHAVTNPVAGVKPQKILVSFNSKNSLDTSAYQIHVLQNSNIADDNETILPKDNPVPVLSEGEIKDLAFQCLKAKNHLGPILDASNESFALDLEFKVDSQETGRRQIYLKQARPYID